MKISFIDKAKLKLNPTQPSQTTHFTDYNTLLDEAHCAEVKESLVVCSLCYNYRRPLVRRKYVGQYSRARVERTTQRFCLSLSGPGPALLIPDTPPLCYKHRIHERNAQQ